MQLQEKTKRVRMERWTLIVGGMSINGSRNRDSNDVKRNEEDVSVGTRVEIAVMIDLRVGGKHNEEAKYRVV